MTPETVEKLLASYANDYNVLLVQRSAYRADVPDALEAKIEKMRATIERLRDQLLTLRDEEPQEVRPSSVRRKSDQSGVLARVPSADDLAPILVPHNLVVDLQEHRRLQEVMFPLAGLMLGGDVGIVVNIVTSGGLTESNQAAVVVAFLSFTIGALLCAGTGFFWGYRHTLRTQNEIRRYIEDAEIVQMPYAARSESKTYVRPDENNRGRSAD